MIGIGIEAMTATLDQQRQWRRADRLGALMADARGGDGGAGLRALLRRLFRLGRPLATPAARPAPLSPWCARSLVRDESASGRRGRWQNCRIERRQDRAAPPVRSAGPGERG